MYFLTYVQIRITSNLKLYPLFTTVLPFHIIRYELERKGE